MSADLPTQVPSPDTTPASSSLLYIVDDPYGTPADNATTLANGVTKGHGLSDGFQQVVSGVMTTKNAANTKSDLSLTKSDVGLGNVVNADTTTTANITDSTNKRFVTDANLTVIGNTSGTNTGDQTLPVKATGAEIDTGTDDAKFATSKAIEDSSYIKQAYADGLIVDSIADSDTTHAPSRNAVFDALALKAPLASPTFTGTVTLPTGLTGVLRADSGVTSVDTDVTDIVTAATTSLAGKVELATDAETLVLTDTGRTPSVSNLRALLVEGWIPETSLPTYSSGSNTRTRVFTATTDATTRMQVGWKVRYTDSTVKYGIIVALAATTITMDMGTDYIYTSTSNPTTFDVSPIKNPRGFPMGENKWAYEYTSSSSSLQATPTMSTFYNPGSLTFTPPRGVWNVQFFGSFRSQSTAAQTSCQMFVYLSTSNNSLADSTSSDMNASTKMLILMGGASGQIEGRLPGFRRFTLTCDGSTAIYPVTMTNATTMQSIGFDNGNTTLYVRLNSVYL